MMKKVEVYKNFKELDESDKKYWEKATMEEREIARDALLESYFLLKGLNPNVQGFTRILRVVKYPQN